MECRNDDTDWKRKSGITLITGYIISREYTDDTLKNIITIPVSFQKILAGKLIISGILSVFLGAVCFAFTVVANFIMGYGGFSISAAFTGLLQMSLLGLLLYLTMLPIIVLTSRKKSSFLAGVIIAFVYGFVGMFANGALQSIYMFRHCYGVKLTELHVDDWTIAKLLGHKGVKSVQYYRKMSNQRMADETREVRNFMSQIILTSLDGWGEEYEQIRQDAGIE